ncbi:MAG: 3-dehydroquinate synthase [Brockia lithotrophica]|nr:3-dehydroquinate synthase [Brockia lithotrophica]
MIMTASARTLWIRQDRVEYPVVVGEGVLDELSAHLASDPPRGAGLVPSPEVPHVLFTDATVNALYGDRAEALLRAWGLDVLRVVVPAGEASKSLAAYERAVGEMLRGGAGRKSVLFALGGGVVGDLGGFVAATYMRGIAFVQLPTTILAHDSAVGGKVGIDHPLAKNAIGAFAFPRAVLYDTALLRTLPPREVRSGLAEIVKHAFLAGEEYVSFLEAEAERITALEPGALAEALLRGIAVKADVVSRDPYETRGIREILNLGHTVGHALETLGGYQTFLHGEAVALGLAVESRIAERLGILASCVRGRLEALLARFGFDLRWPEGEAYDPASVVRVMLRDKKNVRRKIRFVFLADLGKTKFRELDPEGAEAHLRAVLREGA